MNKITRMLLGAVLALPALAFAQGQTGGQTPPAQAQQEIKKDRQDIRKDEGQLKDLWAKENSAVKEINAKEKAAVDAVRADKSLTPDQRKAKIAGIRKDYRAQKKVVHGQFNDQRKPLRQEVHKDRQDVRQEKRQLQQERRDLKQDRHSDKP